MENIAKSGPILVFSIELKILDSINERLVNRKRVFDYINEIRVGAPHGFHPERFVHGMGSLEDVD